MAMAKQKHLRAIEETESGLNTRFVNIESGRTVTREHVIEQIERGNPTYSGYHVVAGANGTEFVRSNPNGKTKDNLE